MKRCSLWALALVVAPPLVFADEIRLKDGSKIMGTIIGYEDSSFKVQTSYGFALIRKDKVTAVIPGEPKPESKAASKKEPRPEDKKPADSGPAENSAQPAAPVPVPKKQAPPQAASAIMPVSQVPSPTATAASAPPPQPPPIREEVRGNLYINHTYGFQMYKPPGWHVIEGAPKTLPTAIVAMGTGDETTLLVIGCEHMKDSLDSQASATERQLREVYEHYRKLSEHRTQVAGLPALERRYRGTVDGRDWSGVVLSLAHGNEIFTILGMTHADSDLIQIQENVIAKAIASLDFTVR